MNKEATLEVAEKALDAIEPVVEQIEETVEAVERIPRLRLNGTTRKQQIIILTFTAVTSAVVTGVVVRHIVRKRMTYKYEEIVVKELAAAKQYYDKQKHSNAKTEKPSIEEVAEKAMSRKKISNAEEDDSNTRLEKEVKYYKKGNRKAALLKDAKIDDPVTHNIFVEGKPMDENFDYEAELAKRGEDRPYIISYDEFMQGEKDYPQNTLTWYEGDDVLTDEKDQPIEKIDFVIGDEAVQRFGHGSGDPRIVYIRNDVMEIDFEVVKHTASYAKTVLGFQHSDRPGSRKRPRYRGDDG